MKNTREDLRRLILFFYNSLLQKEPPDRFFLFSEENEYKNQYIYYRDFLFFLSVTAFSSALFNMLVLEIISGVVRRMEGDDTGRQRHLSRTIPHKVSGR